MTWGTYGWALAISAVLLALLHGPSLDVGLNLGDEGYLWLGAQEARRGRLPIRDFRAYDPGRYYWAAAFMALLGDGLRAVRVSGLVAGALGLAAGITAVRWAAPGWWAVAPAALLLAAWTPPPFKQLDALAGAATTLMAVILARAPSPATALLAGAAVPLSFLVGSNHALYAATGFALVLALQALHGAGPGLAASTGAFALGLAAGAIPLAALLALAPGYARAYWRRKLLPLLRRRATNLPVPIPWPWRPVPPGLAHLRGARLALVRWGFTLLAAGPPAALAAAAILGPRTPAQWAVAGAAAVALGYAHYALSRADAGHLTQGAWPALVALAAALAALPLGWLPTGLLAAASLRWACLPLLGLAGGRPAGRFRAGGTALRLPAEEAEWLERIRALVERHSRPGEPALFVPFHVALHPLLGRPPAAYDVFCVYPATPAEEAELIADLERTGVRLALVDDRALDGLPERSFPRTHPRVWAWLHARLRRLDTAGQLPDHQHLFVNPAPASSAAAPR